jgi:hypothetical protein
VFKSTTNNVASLRRLTSATDSLTIVEGADAITFTLARAVIGGTAHATSVALGPSTAAAGDDSVAMGRAAATNSLVGATVVGAGASASALGSYSAVLGHSASVSGSSGVALGYLASASATRAAALGPSATAEAVCSTALGVGARTGVQGTINFGGIPIARRTGGTVITGEHTLTTALATPLVALTTPSWSSVSGASAVVATLAIPNGAIFFPETIRVWSDTLMGPGVSSDTATISVGTTTGGTDVVNAMPVGLIDDIWSSRAGAIARTKGVTGALSISQGEAGTGAITLRCAIQGFLIDITTPPT